MNGRTKSRFGRLLSWLGFDFSYKPSILDRPPAVQQRREDSLSALERLGYVDPITQQEHR